MTRIPPPALLLTVLLALVLSGCEPMSSAELRREIQAIESLSAEGATLGDQVASQRTKRIFARVQARELGDAAEHSAERLTDAHPGDGLEDEIGRAIELAQATSSALGDIEVTPDGAATAADAADRLRGLSDEAEQLADSL